MNSKRIIREFIRSSRFRKFIIRILNRYGYHPIKLKNYDVYRRIKLIKHLRIDLVLDVGANIGQYASILRSFGYSGRIYSFEPQKSVFSELCKNFKDDMAWKGYNLALGAANGKQKINISVNSVSSSLLNMLDAHKQITPESVYIKEEEIQVETLDNLYRDLNTEGSRVMLKIDAQGYEKYILNGAVNSLPHICMVQLEMALIPCYENEMGFQDMLHYMQEQEFILVSMENEYGNDQTGQLLYTDGIFVRKSFLNEQGLLI